MGNPGGPRTGAQGGGDRDALKRNVRAAARACGFDQVGFAPAETPRHAEEYEAWLARGYHGEMAYLAREDAVRRRLDPREALPGCRTLIVVSLLYGSDPSAPANPTPRERRLPVVARYALGRDYHDVFEEHLDDLAAAIGRLAPGTRTKRYVDYGPVLERDHAQRAGLGWIGKNTMLLHPDFGSYLMLGELLTDLDIEPDPPFVHDRCGTCRRCIDACPTDAILDGRVLDARLCISYLTIELRGSIPEALRPAIGTRVFGCDICQEVCPWNSDAPLPARAPFEPRPGQPMPPADMVAWAEELSALDAESFRARYRGTAFSRPGRDGLLRNLAVGLGNAGGPAARSVLRRLEADPSPLVREHARWAIARLDAPGAA
ncbi:tRNA epoxyqueuosine(34) reductase QueG [Candidatus Palauibacter sp.]|uniref:tRNA epoxyqueuosine(34) reductase QueG n=1 Tax=Candidatus Palauibacter sp. TaxID=3101350 RepID=UPI003B0132BB